MAYPRLLAIAEVAWTPRERKDFADFRARLGTHLVRLDFLDVNYRRP
jgi:hexosaminidase